MASNTHAAFIPQCVPVETTITAPNDISALEIGATESGARLRQLVPIPKGACLEICGDGFNQRTVKTRYDGRFFFVFLRDLESAPTDALGMGAA
jgi:hypothetical protein